MLKLDLHIHSHYSDDAVGTPKEIIKSVQKKGLHGCAITDHNCLTGSLQAVKEAPKDFIVVPGLEISTDDGHLLAYNITQPVERHLSLEETVEQIIQLGGIPVVPHLYRNLSGIGDQKLPRIIKSIPALEIFNSCSLPKTNVNIARVARQYNVGGTGGSDSHDPHYAGYGYTTVDTTDCTFDTILQEIIKKKTWAEGVTMPLSYRRDRMATSIKQYVKRGFRRI